LKWAKEEAVRSKQERMKRKAARRAEREAELARKIAALPDQRYGVITHGHWG